MSFVSAAKAGVPTKAAKPTRNTFFFISHLPFCSCITLCPRSSSNRNVALDLDQWIEFDRLAPVVRKCVHHIIRTRASPDPLTTTPTLYNINKTLQETVAMI